MMRKLWSWRENFKSDLNGAKDKEPLITNSQPTRIVEENKNFLSTTTKSSEYERPIHPIPSSIIMLNEEEKEKLKFVLMTEQLKSEGLAEILN